MFFADGIGLYSFNKREKAILVWRDNMEEKRMILSAS
jgi:hypothetical protein